MSPRHFCCMLSPPVQGLQRQLFHKPRRIGPQRPHRLHTGIGGNTEQGLLALQLGVVENQRCRSRPIPTSSRSSGRPPRPGTGRHPSRLRPPRECPPPLHAVLELPQYLLRGCPLHSRTWTVGLILSWITGISAPPFRQGEHQPGGHRVAGPSCRGYFRGPRQPCTGKVHRSPSAEPRSPARSRPPAPRTEYPGHWPGGLTRVRARIALVTNTFCLACCRMSRIFSMLQSPSRGAACPP